MGLHGTLADMGIVDLIQFPNAGRKTGELKITSTNGTAFLYYEKGKLIHSQLGHLTGQQVLVEIVDWTAGDFEFETDVITQEKSFDVDVHLALMRALKDRDERWLNKKQKQPGLAQNSLSRIQEKLSRFIQNNSTVKYVCIFNDNSQVLQEINSPKSFNNISTKYRSSIEKFLQKYPNNDWKRILVEDSDFLVVCQRLISDMTLLVISNNQGSIGAVSRGVSKLAESVTEVG